MNEIWKPIEGTNGKYEVSNTGKVRSLSYKMTGQIKELTPHEKIGGYLQLRIKIDGKNMQHAVKHGLRDKVAAAASKRGKTWIRELHKMQKKPVIAINMQTGEKMEFESQQEAAETLGLQKSHITSVINGNRNHTGGYTFLRKGGDADARDY